MNAALYGVAFLYALALVASLALPRSGALWIGSGAAGAGAAASLVVAMRVILTGASMPPALEAGLLACRLDGLSAIFLLIIGIVGLGSAIFAIGYTGHYTRAQLANVGAAQAILLASMTLTVLAANVFTFLLAWELMSFAAYLMLMTEPSPETVSAANWYAAIAHAGFAALAGGLLILSSGSLDASFESMRAASHPPGIANAAFVLVFIAFATKAGLVPVHVWLPLAHPVAPSHGSALMSAAVIKMGVYGALRIGFDLLGVGPAWWGGTILVLGAASAIFGILMALVQQDLKRLLAYSSVENIGIVFMGVGAAFLFASFGLPALAQSALVAALFHALNHAAFKGLLFLSAGAVVHSTGTRDMEQLGGLVGRMKWTAGLFFIGACAISALPPLNGFASEWLLFHALLGGAVLPRPEVAIAMPVAVAALALCGGLAAATFVKAFGISFLALPRSRCAADAHEAPIAMRVAMALSAVVCIALGVLPGTASSTIQHALAGSLSGTPAASAASATTIVSAIAFGRVTPLALSLIVIVTAVSAAALVRVSRSGRRMGAAVQPGGRVRIADTWGCGRLVQTARMEYTATAFAEPLRRVFRGLYRPTEAITVRSHPDSPYFIQNIEYRSDVHPWIERVLYERLAAVFHRLALHTRGLQSGSLHLYLSYLFGVLLFLLVINAWL